MKIMLIEKKTHVTKTIQTNTTTIIVRILQGSKSTPIKPVFMIRPVIITNQTILQIAMTVIMDHLSIAIMIHGVTMSISMTNPAMKMTKNRPESITITMACLINHKN